MPIQHYGVLKAYPKQAVKGVGASPHYDILVMDENNKSYRLAVNIESSDQPRALLCYVDTDYQGQITEQLSGQPFLFSALASEAGGLALDYIRGGLFPLDQVDQLFIVAEEAQLNDLLDTQVQQAINEAGSYICAFGQNWPQTDTPDQPFGFIPDDGVHDIHMNQGDQDPTFTAENGPWQDGGLFIYWPSTQQWTAIFLKFQSQAWQTDENGQPD